MYQVELVWNREFYFVPFGDPKDTEEQAIRFAESVRDSGDGERVKKCRVINPDGDIVWNG